MSRLSFLAFGVFTRRAVAETFEMDVSFSARSAFAKNKFLTVARKIDNGTRSLGDFSVVCWPHDCSDRNFDDFVERGAAVHFFAHPVPAAFRFDERLVEKIRKIVGVTICEKNHITAATAIAAVRTALRDKFLPPKADAAAAAGPCLGKNFDSIDKHFLNNPRVARVELLMFQSLSLIAFLTFAGLCCAQISPSPEPSSAGTGIEGVITVSPSHPGPVRPGMTSTAPLANAPFTVSNQTGTVAEFMTDDQGRFQLTVAPGHYSVTRRNQGKIGRCGPFEVDVTNGQMTKIEWRCDSGMR